MNLNIERLGQGERIAAGSALALFACMFLSWFNFGYTASNAWESLHYISPVLAISIVATLGIAFAEVRELNIGDIPGGLVVFVLGCLCALLILFRLIDPISSPAIEGGSTSGSVEAGAFLGFFAALGIAAGGYVTTDGKAVDRLKALLPSSGTTGGFPASPPPPMQPQAVAPTPPPAPATASPVASPATTPPQPTVPAVPDADLSQRFAGPEPLSSPTPQPSVAPADAAEPLPASPEVAPAEPDQPAQAEAPAVPGEESLEGDPRSVFCEGCGSPLRPQDRFCRKCGHKQAQVPEAGGRTGRDRHGLPAQHPH